MRRGFTMIELIFVIVILGILAAVALPRMVGTQEQAREGVAKGFVGTLNRTVGPSLWSKAIMDGNSSVRAHNYSLGDYTDIPDGMDATANGLNNCKEGNITFAIADAIISGNGLYIYCRDGNDTHSPKFWYTDKTVDVNVSEDALKL